MASISVFGLSLILFINTPIVEKIEVVGNRTVARLQLSTQAGAPFDSALVNKDRNFIFARYGETGFFWARVRWDTTRYKNGVKVVFTVDEGRRARVGGVEVRGSVDPAVEHLVPRPGSVFTKTSVEESVEKILEYYDEAGFPLAQVRPGDFRLVDDTVYYAYTVEPGPAVILAGFDFTDNRTTKPGVLARIMKLKLPERYSESAVRSAVDRLTRTALFTVSRYEIAEHDGDYFLKVDVTERKSNIIYGALGYSGGGTGGLTGTLLLEFDNFLSTMRQARISYEKTGSYLEFGVRYVEPWIFGWDLSGGVEINHRTYDTLSAHTELSAFLEAPLTLALKLQSFAGWERNVPFTQTYWLGFGVNLDRLDYPPNPKQGLYYSITSQLGERSPAGVSALKSALDGEADIPLYRNFGFSLGLHGRDLSTADSLYSSELFTLGGARSLRGYNEAQFSSSRLGWGSEEIRLRAGRDSRVFFFCDEGGFKNGSRYDWKIGYGAGIRTATGLGILGFDYGIPGGEKLLSGKIHLSLQGGF